MDSDEHARSTCCGVLDLRQQLVRRCVWQWTVVAGGRRRWFVGADRIGGEDYGAAPAMMVVMRRGATNTTLAATQRHPCRSGMVTADCARLSLVPRNGRGAGGTEGSAENCPRSPSLSPTRAREALMMARRRRRDASYGVARDSHRRKQGDWLTQPPYRAFAQRVSFQRTSTRQQLDCATTCLIAKTSCSDSPIAK